jgi:hypothetical protein
MTKRWRREEIEKRGEKGIELKALIFSLFKAYKNIEIIWDQ